MSRQARQQSNTGVYHVIQRGVNRMLIFHEDADRRMFLDLLKSQAGEFFKVYCGCTGTFLYIWSGVSETFETGGCG